MIYYKQYFTRGFLPLPFRISTTDLSVLEIFIKSCPFPKYPNASTY